MVGVFSSSPATSVRVNEFYKIIERMIFSARLKGGQKKWRLAFLSPPAILKRILNLKTQNFAVK